MYSMSCAELINIYKDPYASKISTCFSKIVEMKPRDFICSNRSYLLSRTMKQKDEERLSNNAKKNG